MKLIYIFIILLAASSGNAEKLSSSINIVQPLNKTRYIGEHCTLVIDTNFKLADKIVITQENNITTTIDIKAGKDTYCKTIKLQPAQNSVYVHSYKDGKLVDKDERDFYFLSELFEGVDEDDAVDYELRYYHTDEKEQKCKSCHNMTSNVPTNGKVFEDVKQTTCYECHSGMLDTKNTHAPAANWLCLDCHNGEVGGYNMVDASATKYLAPDPISKTCGTCHDTVDDWQLNKYGHGPVDNGRCERCHNPHGSENEFFLRKPVWDLCTTCHLEKAKGMHVIPAIGFGSRTKSGGHPTRDRKDPSRPGRDLYCSSCHNPHGSNGTKLLRMKGSFAFGVCQRCHPK
ncbi:cytochrome c3 family protein [Sulfurimonas sp.]|uniref:cytochrome c3 family protein n=1 Tax=Sulfurimonas sp. TaxID=2022749 RepID=UPI003561962D